MVDFITRELSGRGVEAVVAFLLGGLVSWGLGRWRRMRQRQSILRGDARDTVVIEHHIVEAAEAPDPEHPGWCDGRGRRPDDPLQSTGVNKSRDGSRDRFLCSVGASFAAVGTPLKD
jgi:hypothetical protein